MLLSARRPDEMTKVGEPLPSQSIHWRCPPAVSTPTTESAAGAPLAPGAKLNRAATVINEASGIRHVKFT
jgi:hypothetical protein